jgi:hypothetical protein
MVNAHPESIIPHSRSEPVPGAPPLTSGESFPQIESRDDVDCLRGMLRGVHNLLDQELDLLLRSAARKMTY